MLKRWRQTGSPVIFNYAAALLFVLSPTIWAQDAKFDAPLGEPAKPAFDAPLGEPPDSSAEQEVFKQYDASAAQLQSAAIDKLMDAVHLAKVAIIRDDFKDAYQKQAVEAVIETLNKFEEAARDEAKAA